MNTFGRSFLLIPALLVFGSLQAQNIGINTTGAAPAASAMLDISSTDRGFLVPRMTAAQRTAIATPATGLLVFQTNASAPIPANQFWYYDGSACRPLFSDMIGWSIWGNAGTTAGTNFIGTTDAQDFVVKTGGSAAANERMRVLSGGPVVLNRATAATGDVLSVYATGTGGLSSPGDFAINGYTNTGYGIYGEAANATGLAGGFVQTAATGTSTSVWAEAESRNGTGAVGIANTSNAAIPNGTNAIGLQGQVNGTLAATGQAIGVLGILPSTMTTGDANGVWGQSTSSLGTGVMGLANSSTTGGQPIGVYGLVSNATGVGVEAVNQNSSGTGAVLVGNNAGGLYLVNGSGASFTGTGVGGFGYGKTVTGGIGLVGVGNNNASIYTPTRGAGVVGTGTQYGVIGFATTRVNTNPLNNNASSGANASAGGYFEVQNGGTAQTWAYVGVRDNTSTLRKIIGPGTVNTVVRDLSNNLVALSAPEAPENLFQDYGQGQLSEGRAHIELDPILVRNIVVDESHPLRVFIQLEGDCKGVYVTNKTGGGFDVVELEGGSSNTAFTWTVVANRADEVLPDGSISRYSAERFPPAPGPVEKQKQDLSPMRMVPKAPLQPVGTRPGKSTGQR